MRKPLFLLIALFATRFVVAAPVLGVWESDCQDLNQNSDGFYSQKPVDTFKADGTASLRIHVYEDHGCKGKEWDFLLIPCKYEIGKDVPGLEETKELDFECTLNGKVQHWYEIVEATPETLRYGNQTGMVDADRPKHLGSVFYRRTAPL